MSTYTLKSVARRGSILSAVFAIVLSTVLPASSVFADSLNPLTERSLMLSSSAPGFVNTDGAGNAEGNLNSIGEEYAPPGSGPNGRKTGETFSFKVSSGATIKAFTFQYCTSAAGKCRGPGNNDPTPLVSAADGGDADPNRDGNLADTTRDPNSTAWANDRSDLNVVTAFTQASGAVAGGEFQIYRVSNLGVETAVAASDWTMVATNKETLDHTETLTGQNNFITLESATGEAIAADEEVKVVFKASTSKYITNPGAGAFFVKLNTFDTDNDADLVPGNIHNIDGGVTVANVMTDSIHITTKVLETMSFSVGTRNRDLVQLNCGALFGTGGQPDGCEANTGATHGPCDPVQNVNGNRLDLGDPNAEFSLETGKGWGVESYWRLSSNSSGGATVYYSGDTLRNTVGDHIEDMQTETISTPGIEQFGLGFIDPEAPANGGVGDEFYDQHPTIVPNSAPFVTRYDQVEGTGNFAANQDAADDYDEAHGTLGTGGAAGTAKFKFRSESQTVPEPIAQQNTDVISCATAKMRYAANIAADTPAGVYTTKINYLAAPQY